MEKSIVKKISFIHEKNTHNYINYEQFAFYPMEIHHAVSEKSNDKLFS